MAMKIEHPEDFANATCIIETLAERKLLNRQHYNADKRVPEVHMGKAQCAETQGVLVQMVSVLAAQSLEFQGCMEECFQSKDSLLMGVKQLAAYHVRLLHKVVEVDTSPIMQLAERIGSRPEEKRQRDRGSSGGSDRDKTSRQAFDGFPPEQQCYAWDGHYCSRDRPNENKFCSRAKSHIIGKTWKKPDQHRR